MIQGWETFPAFLLPLNYGKSVKLGLEEIFYRFQKYFKQKFPKLFFLKTI